MSEKSLDFAVLKMKQGIFVLTVAILSACSGHDDGHSHATNDKASHSVQEGIVISSARILPPFPGRDTAAGYFEITNHGISADRLISASSPISGTIEIHNHIEDNGVMKMRQVKGVDLAPGETVAFKPGSYHLMMFKTNLTEEQDSVSLTLNYKNADPVTLIVDVEGRGEDEEYGSSHKGDGSGD